MLEVHRPPLDAIYWPALDAFGDRMFSQRRHWLEFIAAFTGGEVIVAELHRGGEAVGYFTASASPLRDPHPRQPVSRLDSRANCGGAAMTPR